MEKQITKLQLGFGVSLKQVEKLINRENRRERLLAQGYVPRPQGRSRNFQESAEAQQKNALVKLRMQMKLLRNFLSEVGRN